MSTELSAAQWLASESADPELVVIGVPNSMSSNGSSANLAPLELRHRLTSFPSFHEETGVDLTRMPARDMGNLPVSSLTPVELMDRLPGMVTRHPESLTVFLGGDRGIRRPLIRAGGEGLETTGVIRFGGDHGVGEASSGPDAGDGVRGLIDDGMPAANIVSIGLHPFAGSRESSAYAREVGITGVPVSRIEQIGMDAVVDIALEQLQGCSSIYVGVDLGVLDMSAAPGATSARPGGLTTRELASGLARCAGQQQVTAFDLVGVEPALDREGSTLDVMAYLLLTVAASRRALSLR